MKSKRNQPYRQVKGLGLDALFGETPATSEGVPLESIKLPSEQPRRYFDPQKMEQLVQSVQEHGILEPLLVRPLDEEMYELVAGERRYRAARSVGLRTVPVVVRQLSDEQALQFALIENLQREDLNPVEETEGILQLIALKLGQSTAAVIKVLHRMQNESEGKVTHNVMGNSEAQVIQEVFSGLGMMRWESFVKNRLPLLNLPEEVIEALRLGKIAYTKAQAITRVKDSQQRSELLKAAIAEDLSLSQIKERIAQLRAAMAETEPEFSSLKSQIDTVYRRVKKSNVWHDPKKQATLKKLLAELEALVSSG
ncbi:MAG: ParB/RepB/Spo0J family partition protein [Symploca sp. SIO2E6]|nr:ParB/RepB/Spo0J family partition protein [Symploca sp. SIO2E6]